MARIELADPDKLSGFLRRMHDEADADDWSTKHVARAFAANADLLESFMAFYAAWHCNEGAGTLDTRIKELVRLRIATLSGCKTCKASREESTVTEEEASIGVDTPEYSFTPRERVALNFAEKMSIDHFSIGDEDIRNLGEYFDQGELLELMVMTGQYIGFGRVLSILQLEDVACPI